MKYIDIHGHMNFAAYDSDRESVIDRAAKDEVGMITVGTDLATSRESVALAEKNSNMWATVGMHPTFVGESHNDPLETGVAGGKRPKQEFDLDQFIELAKNPRVVAIGECGLDYFHSDPKDFDAQREVFLQHIDVANKVNKPLMLHVRNGKEKSAYQEAVEILKSKAKVRANFHFFAGTLDDLHSILEIDGTVSFTGVITFARSYDEIIKAAPITSIMSETDCPYVAPVPYRGKRSEPVYVIDVVKKIAEIRGEEENKIAEQLVENAQNFFNLQELSGFSLFS